ncbi:MAG: MarR family transcriptional regulator [Bacilli bacterium]|nr:MarR family transcriptional regulator [Bacilli bacterium]
MKSIGFEIKEINDLIIKKMMKSAMCEKRCMISPTQVKIIEYLCKTKDEIVYQKDIEKTLNLKRSTVSGILDTMEKNNLISRKSVKEDLRLKEIVLTDYALDKLNLIKRKIKEINNALGKNISEDDLKVFYRVTKQIKQNIINEEV